MTSIQYEVAVPMGACEKPPEHVVDIEAQKGVYSSCCGYARVEDRIVESFSRQDAVEFFAMLRCAFLQIVRWIERKYPDAVK